MPLPTDTASVEPLLAVVIPAYRSKYLRESLASLAAQTNRAFIVYVGDDCSEDGLNEIVDEFRPRLVINYRRFDHNLGATDLIEHWHRCVALSQREPWIWIFSDDDIADPECVAGFFASLRAQHPGSVDLFRFQMDFIDGSGKVIRQPRPHPKRESAGEFLDALLRGQDRAWRAPDHIFSREVYQKFGGFVRFPKALYSDYATWLRYAARGGVQTIQPGRLLWRSHSLGTSSGLRETYRASWQEAIRQFTSWLQLEYGEHPELPRRAARWLIREHMSFNPPLNRAEQAAAIGYLVNTWAVSPTWALVVMRTSLLQTRLRRNRFTRFYFTLWRRLSSPSFRVKTAR